MVDSNFYTTVIGACKRVMSGIVTGHYAFSGTKLHEEKTSERLMKELEAKIDLENRTFQHKIILNNRKYIPNATRAILKAINQLFVCTKKLVVNYPGTGQTGTHPDFIFSDPISDKVAGFPNSRDEIFELSGNWIKAREKINSTLSENSAFLPEEIRNDILKYIDCCADIKNYFYGYYVRIKSEEDFEREKAEYKEQIQKLEFVREKVKTERTYHVLSNYDDLQKLKSDLINKISCYQMQKTEL
ncbi:hypothetical protein R7892_10020 [Ligilactobacillus murinus]|uniref:hypothetical protein n=1 Tax=Ligilactobacillus murinus TaxID=1622 RepID=UPI00296A9199|nr:hypothetical protein [Ligilactobacillus murinus]WOY89002.1 hypothetical protein R7892_10020 [Ligilactobacillus murinus]